MEEAREAAQAQTTILTKPEPLFLCFPSALFPSFAQQPQEPSVSSSQESTLLKAITAEQCSPSCLALSSHGDCLH